MLVLLWSMQCLVACMLTIEVCQQSFCTFCVVRGQVVLHLLLLVCSGRFLEWSQCCSWSFQTPRSCCRCRSPLVQDCDVSSKKLLWFARFKVADVLE